MTVFTLATSCLTTSNLLWFMDLTFQVPMQYCSLQHQALLLSPVTSTPGRCFHFGSTSSFFLEQFHRSSPVAVATFWWGLICQFFLLWTVLLMSYLHFLYLALDIKDSLFLPKVLYFTWSFYMIILSQFLHNLWGYRGFPGGTSDKESACQCRRRKRCRWDPWVGKNPWSWK